MQPDNIPVSVGIFTQIIWYINMLFHALFWLGSTRIFIYYTSSFFIHLNLSLIRAAMYKMNQITNDKFRKSVLALPNKTVLQNTLFSDGAVSQQGSVCSPTWLPFNERPNCAQSNPLSYNIRMLHFADFCFLKLSLHFKNLYFLLFLKKIFLKQTCLTCIYFSIIIHQI